MATERRIKSLKVRQRSLLTSFGLTSTFVDGYNEEAHAPEVPVRLENLVTLWTEYNKVQAELETLDEAIVDEHLKQRAEFESSYYRVKGFLLAHNKIPSMPCATSGSHSAGQIPPSSSHVRLPDVKLPVFNGNLDNWLNFHDLFVSLVHASLGLSNIQKFYYLRSSLGGDALKLIQTIPISANNYLVAWNLLVDHFQNPARLKQSYVDSLFEFPSLKRESAADLHSLVEKFEANVRVLQQLGEKTEFWNILLVRMLSIRLDPTTRRDWEEYSATEEATSFKDLTAFIQRRVAVLQTIQGKAPESSPSNSAKKPIQRQVASHGASQISARKCIACSDNHPLYMCAVFSKMSVENKEKEVRRHQLCRNCLRKGHLARDCNSTSTCKKCRGHHHTQLCASEGSHAGTSKPSEQSQQMTTPVLPAVEQPVASVSATHTEPTSCASTGRGRKNVLLATAVLIVIDDNGTKHTARALLDSRSECSFTTEAFSQRLKASRKKIYLPIAGIGHSSTQARSKILTTIHSRISDYAATVEFLVLPKVTVDLPSTSVDVSTWEIPPGIQLADPSFYERNPIDLVLGAEIFFDLFKVSGRIQLGDKLPTLINSVLGWVVSGKTSYCQPIAPIIANVATVEEVHQLMEKFWVLEEDNASPCYSVEEAACEEHFCQTVARTPEGRYKVRLPFKPDVLTNLGDNRRTALRRFHLLEARLARKPDLGQQYRSFLDDYSTLGHMQPVAEDEDTPSLCYHLPHQAVVRNDSTTTKLRVVFDASCKTAGGPSLNDALMVGPIVQQDLRSIIMRSRTHPIMLIADVKQMYRQILVDKQDTPLQRIVWRSSPDSPIETYELKTVTYGTASAPFLATRVLKQLAEDERSDYPEAAEVLRKDFYVDDLFSGASSIAEAIVLRKQLESLLNKGGFQLRKWASNKEVVLEGLPQEFRGVQSSFDLDRDQCIKTLGLHWEPVTDHLRYKIQLPSPPPEEQLTKRVALSYIAQLFDPLGLVGPVVTSAKLFMQSLWTLKDDDNQIWSWDKKLPRDLRERWNQYHSQLPLLNNLRIERCILCPNPGAIELHFFSDASQDAYGACVYVRSTDPASNVKVALLTAKSKVAPLKKQSIPRLELCAALLAAQLYEKVTSSIKLPVQTFFWVDSTTVLCWLNATPLTWATFVANRTSKIQIATKNCTWNHVAGQQNPADLISRGTTADFLLQNELWWQGPAWLRSDSSCWPTQRKNITPHDEMHLEARKTPAAATSSAPEPSFIDLFVAKFSDYKRMLRVTAYGRRFLQNCRLQKTARPETKIISSEEINEAEANLIRLVQQQTFSEEFKLLKKSQPVSSKSRIKWFHPFLSVNHIIRIGGRLNQSKQPYDSKHQILLPSSHAFSSLLVHSHHEDNFHAAPQLLVNIIRLRYWITGAKSLARTIVHKCIVCIRARPKLLEQFMAELPAARTTATRPFSVTGIDYWGPIYLQPAHRRAAPRKAYVAVFVCFSTKAVHIELVADLSTVKFIQALRRFVSRRGLCSDIYSDNGRNFVGAANELRQLVSSLNHHKAISQECAHNGIRWHFNPPKASHFGGLWEAAIQSAQKHFQRVLGTHTLAYDDMETLLHQIECCLNSRPLVPLSDDPSDFEPLTPGHFLTGSALKAVPDNDITFIPFNRLRRWQQTQQILQNIWKRWQFEYLSTLQARTKWCNPPVEIKPNQLVILKDENTPPLRWPIGRIVKLHPGTDGVTRVVTVQTKNGPFTRPVSKICVLPIASPSIEETTDKAKTSRSDTPDDSPPSI